MEHAIDLWLLKVEGDDLNTQEVVGVRAARFHGEVEVKEIVKRDGDRWYEIDEHPSYLALCRRQ